jgi:hypothetical protein
MPWKWRKKARKKQLPKDKMALTLNGTTNWPKAKELQRLGETRIGATPAHIRQIMERVGQAIADASELMRAYMKEHPKFREIGNFMLQQWEHGLATSAKATWSIMWLALYSTASGRESMITKNGVFGWMLLVLISDTKVFMIGFRNCTKWLCRARDFRFRFMTFGMGVSYRRISWEQILRHG